MTATVDDITQTITPNTLTVISAIALDAGGRSETQSNLPTISTSVETSTRTTEIIYNVAASTGNSIPNLTIPKLTIPSLTTPNLTIPSLTSIDTSTIEITNSVAQSNNSSTSTALSTATITNTASFSTHLTHAPHHHSSVRPTSPHPFPHSPSTAAPHHSPHTNHSTSFTIGLGIGIGLLFASTAAAFAWLLFRPRHLTAPRGRCEELDGYPRTRHGWSTVHEMRGSYNTLSSSSSSGESRR